MKNKLSVFTFILLHCPIFSQAQVIHGAPKYKFLIDYKKHFGHLILNDGQSITGTFEYSYFEFPVRSFKYYSDSVKLIKRYKKSEIKSITFAGSDTTLSNRDSTYFIKIDKSLYRQLTFGSIKIYDPLINVNEKDDLIYSDLVVLENSKPKNFHSEKKILKYIEDKLKEENIEQKFKSVKESIRYLNFAKPDRER
ncbi:MAG: hypothetical protein ABI359_05585 [Ginsengibacter sp.]